MDAGIVRFGGGYVDPRTQVQAALALVSAVQHLSPAQQVSAVSVLFALLQDEVKFSVSDEISRARAILHNGDLMREVSALRQFIQEEILK